MRYSIWHLWFRYLNHSDHLKAAVLAGYAAAIFLPPWLAVVGGPLMRVSPWLGWCSSLLLLTPSGWLAWLGLRAASRSVRLIVSGRPVCGVITGVGVWRHRKSQGIDRLTYSYRGGDDGDARGYTAESAGAPYQPGEIQPGSRVLVLYDAENPCLSEIDRFDARPDDRLRLLR